MKAETEMDIELMEWMLQRWNIGNGDFCLLLTACHTGRKPTGEKTTVVSPAEPVVTIEEPQSPVIEKSRTALYLDSLGLINIQSADSSIAVKLLYATPENFTGELLYEDLKDAYLHPDALKSLLRAQQL